MLSAKRKEGITDEDIRWAWNMPDLERRLMIDETVIYGGKTQRFKNLVKDACNAVKKDLPSPQ